MSEESSEFKPLPRRSNRKRKARAVGSSTPSAPRKSSRARVPVGRADETAGGVRRTRRKRKASPFGFLRYVALVLVAGVGVFVFMNLRAAPATVPTPDPNFTPDPNATAIPTDAPFFPIIALPQLPTAVPTRPPTPVIPEVAIVAGHWAKEADDGVPTVRDSGAVCPDGLREVDITKSVSDKLLTIMQGRNYHAILLQEFDPLYEQEPKFKPRVYLSIHADSCLTGADYAYATGYKIAHAEPSNNEQEDSRLVTCLTDSYDQVATLYNKPFNVNTITRNMTEYHGFRKVDPTTPAAIIELGFMGWDREFLVDHQDEMARALAIGLDEFLKGSSCLPPTATPEPTETVLP